MTDALLCVMHSTRDQGGYPGCLSVYYSGNMPTISYARYVMHNNNLQVFPLTSIASIRAETGVDNIFNIFLNGQPIPTTFFMNTNFDVWSLIQIMVSNGIINASIDKPSVWVPANGVRPSDPIEWIFNNSPVQPTLAVLNRNSAPGFFQSSVSAIFSQSAHRISLERLIEQGKKTEIYKKLLNPTSKEDWRMKLDAIDRMEEYSVIKRQWESRIPQQNAYKSKFALHSQRISHILDQKPLSPSKHALLKNVLYTMITYAPDIGFRDEMVDILCVLAQLVLDDPEADSESSQAMLFWSLESFLFKLGQEEWFKQNDMATEDLIDVISDCLTNVYPAIGYFVSFNDYEMFKHCVDIMPSMMTEQFDSDILISLLELVYASDSISVMYSSILVTIFILQFQELSKSRMPDVKLVGEIVRRKLSITKEDDFFAIVSAVSEHIEIREKQHGTTNYSLKLFKPLNFEKNKM